MADNLLLESVAASANELRRAVEASDFVAAGVSVRRYAEALAQLPAKMALAHAGEALRLLDWGLRTLSAARARVQCLTCYHAADVPMKHSWRVDI